MTIDAQQLHKLTSLTGSANDQEALLALKDLHALLAQHGTRLEDIVHYGATSDAFWQSIATQQAVSTTPAAAQDQATGMPECQAINGGIETAPPGGTMQQWPLAGTAGQDSQTIATRLKDALVVAGINSCEMKIKLNDLKDDDDKIVATIVQAEYDREFAPIIIWKGERGEAATLASTLRQAMKHALQA